MTRLGTITITSIDSHSHPPTIYLMVVSPFGLILGVASFPITEKSIRPVRMSLPTVSRLIRLATPPISRETWLTMSGGSHVHHEKYTIVDSFTGIVKPTRMGSSLNVTLITLTSVEAVVSQQLAVIV